MYLCTENYHSMTYTRKYCQMRVEILFQKNSKKFCTKLNIEQAVSSLCHHQSNGQVEAYIKFLMCTLEKCRDTNADWDIALLQIKSALLGHGYPVLQQYYSTAL